MSRKKTLKDNWPEIATKLRFKYPILKDCDLTYRPGNEEKMLETIQNKINCSREHVMFEISNLLLEE